jgi:hypothetical protein
MPGGGADLAQVRGGIYGISIAAKVELRGEGQQGEAQRQQLKGKTVPAHRNTNIG